MKKLSEVPEITKVAVYIANEQEANSYWEVLERNALSPQVSRAKHAVGYCLRIEGDTVFHSSKAYYATQGYRIITLQEFLYLVEKSEKYTIAECQEQRISIKVSNDLQRDIVTDELSGLLGYQVVPKWYGHYIRTYKVEDDLDFGHDTSSYLSRINELYKATKEITFDQLILTYTKMQDLNKPIHILGKKV